MKNLDKLWVGLVEDNKDPDHLGRVKVRVQSIYDDIPVADIPWASPMKSLSARSYEIPAIGKIVSVMFPNYNLYEPYYMFSDHYNVNLKKKLDDLGDDEYVNFVAVVFDHRTKVYSDDKSLTMDYMYNKITVTNDDINLELKDNQRKVNIGCKTASQQAILGNHWMDWFDKFVNTLVKPESLMGNQSAPILKPEIDQLLVEYQTLRETFLSDHVNIVDDNKVDKLQMKYNSPFLDDGVKINSNSVAGNVSNDPNQQDLSDKIKEQKNKELDKLKDAIPSDAIKDEQVNKRPVGYQEQNATDNLSSYEDKYYEIK